MFLVSPGPQVFPPPLSWFSLQQRSFRSGNRGGKHVARSICKTVPYEGEPQLTLKFPVPIFHQTNQTAPKKTLEFLRLSKKKRNKETLCKQQLVYTKHHEITTHNPTNQKNENKRSSLKALRPRLYAHPAKLSTWRLPTFFWVGGRQSRIIEFARQ